MSVMRRSHYVPYHKLGDEFIFGAFNVLWLDITMDDASKTNAAYSRSTMKTLNLIEHPNSAFVQGWAKKVDPRFG